MISRLPSAAWAWYSSLMRSIPISPLQKTCLSASSWRAPKRGNESTRQPVAEVLQLAHLLERKPKALSGGQRQRVAIGRTLVAEPRVFCWMNRSLTGRRAARADAY